MIEYASPGRSGGRRTEPEGTATRVSADPYLDHLPSCHGRRKSCSSSWRIRGRPVESYHGRGRIPRLPHQPSSRGTSYTCRNGKRHAYLLRHPARLSREAILLKPLALTAGGTNRFEPYGRIFGIPYLNETLDLEVQQMSITTPATWNISSVVLCVYSHAEGIFQRLRAGRRTSSTRTARCRF